MWPLLGASPDALILDKREESMYGAVEVKYPASKSGMSIINACSDKSFCLEIANGKPCLKKNHVYYYQVQGVHDWQKVVQNRQRCCNFFNFHADCTKFSMDIEHIILTNRAVFVFGTPKI
jgi:hypothetical protein